MMVINLFWVLAYDTEYAMVDRDDDLQIGMKTSAITLGQADVLAVMGFYAVYLFGFLWWATPLQLGWPVRLAWLLAFLQVLWHFSLIRDRTREGCFQAFRQNHWLAATLFLGVVVAYALK